jgi:hypothetical protein
MFSFEGWRLPCRLNVFHGGIGIKKLFLINIIGFFPGVKVYILVIKTLDPDSELDPQCSKSWIPILIEPNAHPQYYMNECRLQFDARRPVSRMDPILIPPPQFLRKTWGKKLFL